MLQPGRQSQAAGNISVMPAAGNAHGPDARPVKRILDNPSHITQSRVMTISRLPSVRAGWTPCPKVTRDPDGEPDMYIFSDGVIHVIGSCQNCGMRPEKTGFRVHVLFKPWPGRLQCVIGHLAENEVRGELSFIEKAQDP